MEDPWLKLLTTVNSVYYIITFVQQSLALKFVVKLAGSCSKVVVVLNSCRCGEVVNLYKSEDVLK